MKNPPLSPERAQQIRQIFDEVVELDPEARAARLTELDREDHDLRQEIEALLRAYEEADEVLRQLEQPGTAGGDRLIGRRVSHYQILEQLGGGGMASFTRPTTRGSSARWRSSFCRRTWARTKRPNGA